jgi:hypothetical protein
MGEKGKRGRGRKAAAGPRQGGPHARGGWLGRAPCWATRTGEGWLFSYFLPFILSFYSFSDLYTRKATN